MGTFALDETVQEKFLETALSRPLVLKPDENGTLCACAFFFFVFFFLYCSLSVDLHCCHSFCYVSIKLNHDCLFNVQNNLILLEPSQFTYLQQTQRRTGVITFKKSFLLLLIPEVSHLINSMHIL